MCEKEIEGYLVFYQLGLFWKFGYEKPVDKLKQTFISIVSLHLCNIKEQGSSNT